MLALYPTGTFYARERLPVLFQFVREVLQNDWLPFELRASGGQKLVEDEALALNECGLVSWGCDLRWACTGSVSRFPSCNVEGTSKELTGGSVWRRWCGEGVWCSNSHHGVGGGVITPR